MTDQVRARWIVLVGLAYMLAANLVFVQWPFTRRFNGGNAQAAIQAYAHIRYGFAATRGGNIFELLPYQEYPIPADRHYISRPPFFNYLYLPGLVIFGKAEWTISATNILLTIPTAWLLWLVLCQYCPPAIARWAFLAWCVLPATMSMRQGAIPENITLLCTLYMLWHYPAWSNRPAWKLTVRLTVAAVLAVLLNYDGILTPLVLCLIESWRRRWHAAGILAGILLVQAAAMAVFAVYLVHIVDVPLVVITGKILGRTVSGFSASVFADALHLFMRWHWFNLNPVGIIVIVLGIAHIRGMSGAQQFRLLTTVFLLLYVLYAVFFANAFMRHSYIMLQDGILCALLLGAGLAGISRWRRWLGIGVFLLFMSSGLWFWYHEFTRGGLERNVRFATLVRARSDDHTLVMTNRDILQAQDTWYLERWYVDLLTSERAVGAAMAAPPARCTSYLFVHDFVRSRENQYAELEPALQRYLDEQADKEEEVEGLLFYRLPPPAGEIHPLSQSVIRNRTAPHTAPMENVP